MIDHASATRQQLAPTGTLRVGINTSNFLLAAIDGVTGEAHGVAIDLGLELGQRLRTSVTFIPYPNAGTLVAAVDSGAWDVAFAGIEPERADGIRFSEAYAEVEATYLVGADSGCRTTADVDRADVRIAVLDKSAYDLFLTRTLEHARLIRTPSASAAFECFVRDGLEALADLKPRLLRNAERAPGSRLVEGYFTVVQQGIGTPRDRDLGAQYLQWFIRDILRTGLVAETIRKHNAVGLNVPAHPRQLPGSSTLPNF